MILRTENGGATWGLLPQTAVPAPLKGEGGFASSNSCAISVDSRHGWIAASEPGARVFGTDDAGKTWTMIASSTPFVHDSMAGITALSFRDARHGIGVAARVDRAMARDTSPAAVATTDDGGATWTLRHRPPRPGSLSGVALVPAVNAGNRGDCVVWWIVRHRRRRRYLDGRRSRRVLGRACGGPARVGRRNERPNCENRLLGIEQGSHQSHVERRSVSQFLLADLLIRRVRDVN